MTKESKEYQLFGEIIDKIYINTDDKNEALNIIDKLNGLVDLLDSDNEKHLPKNYDKDKYFPVEPE